MPLLVKLWRPAALIGFSVSESDVHLCRRPLSWQAKGEPDGHCPLPGMSKVGLGRCAPEIEGGIIFWKARPSGVPAEASVAFSGAEKGVKRCEVVQSENVRQSP